MQERPGICRWIFDIIFLCAGVSLIIAFFKAVSIMSKVIIFERDIGEPKPDEFNLPYVPLQIPVESTEIKLNAWHIPAPNAKATVIFGQELKASKSSKLKYARFLYQAGYSSVLFDNRVYRQPEKIKRKIIASGMHERVAEDFKAVVKFVKNSPDICHHNIILFPFCFSTMPILKLLSRPGFDVDAIIFESGPAIDMANMTRNYIDWFRPYIVPYYLNGPILFPILRLIYTALTKLSYLSKEWPPKLIPTKVRLLFLLCEDDTLIPVSDTKKIIAQYPGAKCWIGPGSRHLMAFRDHKESYKKAVLDFLDELSQKNNQDQKLVI